MSVFVFFSLDFWMEYLFMLDQKANVDFCGGFFPDLLTRSDGRFFECSHESRNLKKIAEGMKVILHHKAC